MASKWSLTALIGQIEIDVLAHSNVGCTSSVTCVSAPSAPRCTTQPLKTCRILRARHVKHAAVGGHDFEGRHRGREVAVGDAGPVCRRGTCAGDRDVWQRRKIVEGKSLLVQLRTQLPVAHARFDGHGLAVLSRATTPCISPTETELCRAVRDAVEAMARAEHAEIVVRADELLHLLT